MPSANSRRLHSVDAVRGLVMILMAIDHVRDFNHVLPFSPEDLTKTNAVLFFTRWVTHFCAPVFCFTAGIGAGLSRRPDLSSFLLKRGLWLLLLEVTMFRFVISFNFKGPVLLVVLWALGCSMIALAAMVKLPWKLTLVVSLGMIALHHLADGVKGLAVLHEQGPIAGGAAFVAYPLVPWIGVMGAGYVFARWLDAPWVTRLGLALLLAFVVLRFVNVYGDPSPWDGASLLSFLRTTKYPVSLQFLLMTLGPAIALLGWWRDRQFSDRNPLLVFGRTPMFYFIVHLYLGHLIALPLGTTTSLGEVYVRWAAVVLLMYPLCVWFAGVKERHRDWWWLSYL